MSLKSLSAWSLYSFLALGLALPCSAQELQARRWGHLPMGANFAGAGYSYTEADIFLDPILRLEDVEMEMHTWAARYIRTFELLEKSVRVDFVQAIQRGRWTGLVDGVPASARRTGLSDSIVRLAINLYGAPPLEGKEFAEYRAKTDVETIVGAALAVHLPTGEYMDDKLINLGTNRFTFRPQLGVVHSRGRWSMEVTGAVWFYTHNDEFFNGNKLENDPLYTIQGHLVYNFRPGLWSAASAGYGYGAESTVNGERKRDRKGNLVWALGLGYPITPRFGVSVRYIGTRSQESVGQDSDNVLLSFSVLW